MSFLKGFKNDLFISYSHSDDSEGWVQQFQTRLCNRLRQIMGMEGAAITVWRDRKLEGTDSFSTEIFEQLKSSALLISIVSPCGLQSNWCQEERQKFEAYAASSGGLRIGNTVRAVKVVKTPLDNDEHRALFGTLGFEFYERDPQANRFIEFPVSSTSFETKLDQMAQNIRSLLTNLRNHPLKEERTRTVYVALTSPELLEVRKKLVAELAGWGFRTLPDEEAIPVEQPGFRTAVNRALDGCELTVHLIGEKRGVIPEDETSSALALQYELARIRKLPSVIWIEPGKKPHESLVEILHSGEGQSIDVLENQPIEDLKRVLEGRLKRLQGATLAHDVEAPRLNLYLLCDLRDHPYSSEHSDNSVAKELKAYLDRCGYTVWLPPVNVTEEKVRRDDHRETLRISDAVLLFWGDAGEAWFRKQLRELTLARTLRSHRPFLARAIYLANPPNGKDQYRNHLDLVIEQFGPFQSQDLASLEAKLNGMLDA